LQQYFSTQPLTPPHPVSSRLQHEQHRRIEFCETERRSSAVLVDSLSQRLAEEESASQELKATLAVVQVDCSIAQVHLMSPSSPPYSVHESTQCNHVAGRFVSESITECASQDSSGFIVCIVD
jgi:hypothetical protein